MIQHKGIVTIDDGTENELIVYVTYELQREEREDGFVRIPAGICIDKIQLDSFDGYDMAPLLYQYGIYDSVCDDIIKGLDYEL